MPLAHSELESWEVQVRQEDTLAWVPWRASRARERERRKAFMLAVLWLWVFGSDWHRGVNQKVNIGHLIREVTTSYEHVT